MSHSVLEIEGTWEEVAARAPELAGRRVRLTVLQDHLQEMDEAFLDEHPLLRHVGTWQGDDLEECLAAVIASRSPITIKTSVFDQNVTAIPGQEH